MNQSIRHIFMLKSDEGSNIVELALLMPVLLLMLVGAVDFGRAYYVAIEVNSAAHAGALYGSQNPFIPPNSANSVPLLNSAGISTATTLDAADISLQTPVVTSGCECYDGSHNSTSLSTCSTETDPCVISGSSNIGNLVYWVKVTTSATYVPILTFPGIPTSFTFNGQSTMRAAY